MTDIVLKLGKDDNPAGSLEQVLVEGCLREERRAQKELYERYYGKMMAVCLRYSNNQEDARDILNEGFIKVFRYLHRYQIGTSLECWIRRIMINTAIDLYRKASRHRTEDLDTVSNLVSEEADVVSEHNARDIMAAIQQLPPAYRTVFNLYAIEGYSHREISEALNISEGTSRSNLVKARTKLRELLHSIYNR